MDNTIKKKSHRSWRKEVKKLRRKKIRQKLAKERDAKEEQELSEKMKNPTYLTWLAEQHVLELFKVDEIIQQNNETHKQFIEYDRKLLIKWQQKVEKLEAIQRVKEEQKQKIKLEFEAKQEKIKKSAEEKQRQAEEKQKQYEELGEKIEDFIYNLGPLPEELTVYSESNPGRPPCGFFQKTSTCRFGIKCDKNHKRPGISKLLLIPNFFHHIRLDQSAPTEYGSDFLLEYDHSELQRAYDEFFNDVTPEFLKFGKVIQFRTCYNQAAHLRGHTYVEFEDERDSLKAYRTMQGRYYASRMLNIEFCSLISWKSAVCGLSCANKCPKGRGCNYLHVFRNPQNKFPLMLSREPYSAALLTANNSKQSWNDDADEIKNKHWKWSDSPEHQSSITLSHSYPKQSDNRSIENIYKRDKSPQRSRKSTVTSERCRRSSDRSSPNSRKHSVTKRKSSSNEYYQHNYRVRYRRSSSLESEKSTSQRRSREHSLRKERRRSSSKELNQHSYQRRYRSYQEKPCSSSRDDSPHKITAHSKIQELNTDSSSSIDKSQRKEKSDNVKKKRKLQRKRSPSKHHKKKKKKEK